MQRSTKILQAEAGPRIHAPRRRAPATEMRAAAGDLLDHRLHRQARSGREAAALLLRRLEENPLGVLPWGLDRRDPVRHLGWIIAAGGVVPAVLLVVGVPMLWGLGWTLLCGLAAHRLLSHHGRRSAIVARDIQSELEHGAALIDIEDQLESLVHEAPEHDAARLLLALTRLTRHDALGALLQLAPLRDRHPGEGAVVLLAALAYAEYGAEADALRMLEVLRVDQCDAWSDDVARFHELCLSAALGARASSGDIETEV